eukprot:GHVU01131042.1.p1 GENE.GHVU01131042.1~~GHVU01131042.1.p1  ORF type:complete len:139 (+),score=13.42 GHVU01131042.1:181-597(+)
MTIDGGRERERERERVREGGGDRVMQAVGRRLPASPMGMVCSPACWEYVGMYGCMDGEMERCVCVCMCAGVRHAAFVRLALFLPSFLRLCERGVVWLNSTSSNATGGAVVATSRDRPTEWELDEDLSKYITNKDEKFF